jgi:hypothetical protein
MKQAVRTFNLKMFNSKEEERFTKFQKVATYNGFTPRDVLLSLVDDYLRESTPGIKLATESEVLEEAKRQGLKTNKALLIKHRTAGNLKGMWFSNDDGRIVYNLTPVIKFLKGRKGRGSGTWLNRRKDEGIAA